MLFEKQQHQEDCVKNIRTALKGINLKEIDLLKLKDNLKQLGQNTDIPEHLPHAENKRIDVLMETGTGKTFVYLQTIFELYKHHNQRKFIIVVPRTAIKLGVIQQIKQTREYFYRIYEKHLSCINYPEDGLGIIQQSFIASKDLSVLIITNSSFNKKDNTINRTAERPLEGMLTSTWEAICNKKPVVLIDEPHLLKGNKTTEYLNMLEGLTIRFGATFPGKLHGPGMDKEDKESKESKEDKSPKAEQHLSNVAYCLDSISAFNEYLVKRIRVNTVFVNSEESALHVHNLVAKRQFDAFYNINEEPKKKTVRINSDLGARTGLEKYTGVKVVKITANKILLGNRQEIEASKGNYSLNDDEILTMIQRTIRLHFEKEETLFAQGIKALALFFIPGVNDFRGESPQIKLMFEEQYKKIRKEFYDKTKNAAYKKYLDADYNDKGDLLVHEGYFAGDKKGKTKEEKEANAIDTILNDKESLLSFEEPLRFVFSVWALQEGWDNPNIFTICKLYYTSKEVSRRQQVGRGLRIAVNQKGRRLTYAHMKESDEKFYDINTLDMVVSSQEQGFVHEIQQEIADNSFSLVGDTLTSDILKEKGLSDDESSLIYYKLRENGIIDEEGTILMHVADFMRDNQETFTMMGDKKLIEEKRFNEILKLLRRGEHNPVENANARPVKVKVRQDRWEEFQDLWQSINKEREVLYSGIEKEKLIGKIAKRFNSLDIKPRKQLMTTEVLKKSEGKGKSPRSVKEADTVYEIDNESEYYSKQTIGNFIKELAFNEKLPLTFLCDLFSKLNVTYFKNDPAKAKQELISIIKGEIHQTILQHVSYHFSRTTILSNSLQDEDGKCKEELRHTVLGRFYSKEHEPRDHFLYDKVVYDSKIEKKAILKDPARINGKQITVFAKLPKISIPTPYKTYSPDFAYLIQTEDKKELFLVVETKGYDVSGQTPKEQEIKIGYAEKFFKDLEAQMKENNPEFVIRFRKRINKEELSLIITEAFQDIPETKGGKSPKT